MGSTSSFTSLFLIFAILAVRVAVSSSLTVDSVGEQLDFLSKKSECRGSMAECLMEEEEGFDDMEFAMDSESNRRILAWRRYISYGALRRNTVPCSRRGASYYNCRRGAQVNPYSRGCSRITRCRG